MTSSPPSTAGDQQRAHDDFASPYAPDADDGRRHSIPEGGNDGSQGARPPPPARRPNRTTKCQKFVGIATVVLMLSAVSTLCSAMATHKWRSFKATTEMDVGLFKVCHNGDCTDWNFEDVTTGLCTVSGADLKQRIYGSRALLVLTLILIVCLALPLQVLVLLKGGLKLRAGLVFVIGISFFLAVIGTALFARTISVFIFCDMTYCEFVGRPNDATCKDEWKESFALGASCCSVLFVTLVMNLVVMAQAFRNYTKAGAAALMVPVTRAAIFALPPDTDQQPAAAKALPGASPPTTRAGDVQKPKDLEADDWVFDAESGLMWSDTHYLYKDQDTGHYYDPQSTMWYNPETTEWYTIEEEE